MAIDFAIGNTGRSGIMPESVLAAIQRQQIEAAVGELLLTSDYYIRLEVAERLRHLIAHADPTLDPAKLSEMAQEELQELNLLPPHK